MSSEVTRFVGSVPQAYAAHLVPTLFAPFARELVARMPEAAARVLEVAAGTGCVTRELLAGTRAAIVATDLNEPMLDEARAVLSDPRVQWQVADAQALPFGAGAFDAVVCQFGLMFVPDKQLAMREMRRVLVRGGTLLLDTWSERRKNAAQSLVHDLAVAACPDDPPRFLDTPFSMPDGNALVELALAAGFAEARVETIEEVAHADSAQAFAVGLVRGTPLWHQLAERGIDGEAFERQVTARLVAAFGDHPCRSPLSAQLLTAVA